MCERAFAEPFFNLAEPNKSFVVPLRSDSAGPQAIFEHASRQGRNCGRALAVAQAKTVIPSVCRKEYRQKSRQSRKSRKQRIPLSLLQCWWARQDLNLGPTDYAAAALTAELRAPRMVTFRFYNVLSLLRGRFEILQNGNCSRRVIHFLFERLPFKPHLSRNVTTQELVLAAARVQRSR